ncbi:hypothetical protein FPV67DRAFT_30162 [Lyophyllum atratum]|nr:hypothetical protein FPV67DRAFT_30162 [Lyophyllum atratum]
MYTTSFSEPFSKRESEHEDHGDPIPVSSEPQPYCTSSLPSSAFPTTIQLEDPGNATACSSLTFFWTSSPGHPILMTLSIVHWHAPFVSAKASSPLAITTSPSKILAVNILSDSHQFIWQTVDVPEGWYVVDLTETVPTSGTSTKSSPFFITEGSDASCRYNSFSASHKPPNLSHHPTPHHLHPAELVGIVLGVIFGVCVLTLAFLFPRLWRRSLPSPKKRRSYILY